MVLGVRYSVKTVKYRDLVWLAFKTYPQVLLALHRPGNQWRDMLSEEPLHSRIVALAVDEAHCVYKWGSDFRPTYARVHELRALIPSGTPMLAATATDIFTYHITKVKYCRL